MLEFTLNLGREEAKITDSQGVTKTYFVTELPGDELEDYMNSVKDVVTIENGKVTGMKSFKGMFTSLLKFALLDDEGNKVSVDKVKSWPSRTQKGLFEAAQKLNGLDADAVEEAKND